MGLPPANEGDAMNISHSEHLHVILNDRAALYSGSRKGRASLVDRTLMASSHAELEFDLPVDYALFRLMHRLAFTK